MKGKLAVQMYTVRDHTRTADDLATTLARLREIGYEAVQLSAVGAMSGDSPVGTTVNAFTTVSLDPALVLVCLQRGSRLLTAVERSGVFAARSSNRLMTETRAVSPL